MRDAYPARLDIAVVHRELAESRARAHALILAGGVSVDGVVITKPSASVAAGAIIALTSTPLPYVSRGGLKLEHALNEFRVQVQGRTAVDVGASTGGFTDVLLQRGATRVYAIDVGYGQLAWKLRQDPRVVVMERTNVRGVQSLPEETDLGTVDVSFISLRLVLPVLATLLAQEACVIALIKPQFEAGRKHVGRNGVIRDARVWQDVLENVLGEAESHGWVVAGLTVSPIRGPAGNVEFLARLDRGTVPPLLNCSKTIEKVLASIE